MNAGPDDSMVLSRTNFLDIPLRKLHEIVDPLLRTSFSHFIWSYPGPSYYVGQARMKCEENVSIIDVLAAEYSEP
jgi:hypothetical protein